MRANTEAGISVIEILTGIGLMSLKSLLFAVKTLCGYWNVRVRTQEVV